MELTGTNSLTKATWEAIDFFLKHDDKEGGDTRRKARNFERQD